MWFSGGGFSWPVEGVVGLEVMVKVISPILAGGNVLFAVRLIAGTLGTLVTGVEPPRPSPPSPRYLEGGVLGQGSSSGVHGKGANMVLGGSGEGRVFPGAVRRWCGYGWREGFGPTGRDQSYTPQGEPTFRKGAGAKVGGKGGGIPGALEAGIGCDLVGFQRLRVDRVVRGEGVVQDPLPVGPVLSQRDQALGALKMLAEVLGPVVGPQV